MIFVGKLIKKSFEKEYSKREESKFYILKVKGIIHEMPFSKATLNKHIKELVEIGFRIITSSHEEGLLKRGFMCGNTFVINKRKGSILFSLKTLEEKLDDNKSLKATLEALREIREKFLEDRVVFYTPILFGEVVVFNEEEPIVRGGITSKVGDFRLLDLAIRLGFESYTLRAKGSNYVEKKLEKRHFYMHKIMGEIANMFYALHSRGFILGELNEESLEDITVSRNYQRVIAVNLSKKEGLKKEEKEKNLINFHKKLIRSKALKPFLKSFYEALREIYPEMLRVLER